MDFGCVIGSLAAGYLVYWFSGYKSVPAPATKASPATASSEVHHFDEAISSLQKQFSLSQQQLSNIVDCFGREMKEGLGPNSKSSLLMVPSFIGKLPKGTEKGDCIAIDVGGTNLRVLKVTLDGNGNIKEETVKKPIPESVQHGPGEGIFDLIADAVKELVGTDSPKVPLGYTFSFPVKQLSVNSGLLVKWTKGFTAPGVVGEDVVKLLNNSLAKKGLKLRVNALINDTVGTQLAGCYQSVGSFCFTGAIVGTGSNTCYIEKVSNITKYTPQNEQEKNGFMVINMESGNFGSRPDRIGLDLPLNEFDVDLDLSSPNKGQQLLEKQISGMYLGEILRIVLRKYISDELLFREYNGTLTFPYKLTTEEMSVMESDDSKDLVKVNEILAHNHHVKASTLEERQFVKTVCNLVATRGAQLAACQLVAIYRQILPSLSSSSSSTSSSSSSSSAFTINPSAPLIAAMDGSVFMKYPGFATIMGKTIDSMIGPNKIKMVTAKDGSGNGAALAAVTAAAQQ